MPDFYYEGTSREGEKVKGHIFADNEVDVRIKLRSQRVRPNKIKAQFKKQEKQKVKTFTNSSKLSHSEKLFFIKKTSFLYKKTSFL